MVTAAGDVSGGERLHCLGSMVKSAGSMFAHIGQE